MTKSPSMQQLLEKQKSQGRERDREREKEKEGKEGKEEKSRDSKDKLTTRRSKGAPGSAGSGHKHHKGTAHRREKSRDLKPMRDTTRRRKEIADRLPSTHWGKVFAWLPERDLGTVSLVCQRFRRAVISTEVIWKVLWDRRFEQEEKAIRYRDWTYRNAFLAKMNMKSLHFTEFELKGHTGAVNEIDFCDGRMTTASSDDKIRLWSRSFKHKTLVGHTDRVTTVQFIEKRSTHCQERLVSGSDDSTVRIWNGKSCSATLNAHRGRVNVLRLMSQHKTKAVVAAYDHVVMLWDLEKQAVSAEMKEEEGPVLCLTTNPATAGPDTFVTGSRDGSLKLWDVRTGTVSLAVKAHEAAVTCLAPADNRIIFTGSADHTITEFDLRTVEEVQTIESHTGPVRAVACDETRLISGSFDRSVRVFDRHTGALLKTIEPKNADSLGTVRSLHFSERGIYSGWMNGSLMIYDFTLQHK